jgi:HAMP domain-containing protein
MTDQDVARIEARARKSTLDAGMWSLEPAQAVSLEDYTANVEFMNHAKDDVLHLVAEVYRLRGELALARRGLT